MIQVRVAGVALDPTGQHVVLLKPIDLSLGRAGSCRSGSVSRKRLRSSSPWREPSRRGRSRTT